MGCLNLPGSLSRLKFAVITNAEAVHKVRAVAVGQMTLFPLRETENRMGKGIFKKLLAPTAQFLRAWSEDSRCPALILLFFLPVVMPGESAVCWAVKKKCR